MNMTASIRTIVRGTFLAVGVSALSLPALAAVVSHGVQTPGAVATKTTRSTAQVLPPTLRPVFYGALANDAGAAYNLDSKGCATLPKQRLKACFDRGGAHFTGAGSSLALHLVAYGRNRTLTPVSLARPVFNANRVSYAHGNLTEWWRALPVGFEQGFTLAKRPVGHGQLTLVLAANDRVSQHDGALGWGQLRYGQLVVTDAKGKVVPATLTSEGDRVLIAVNDSNAVYPLTADPLVWIEQKVTGSDAGAGALFGTSLAIFGSTALIGAPYATVNGNAYQGAAYMFTESNGVWSEIQKLTANDGQELDELGYSVALDNTIAFVGAPNSDVTQGAVYVFTESDGIWTQAQKLTASDGSAGDFFGQHTVFSGNTAIVSAGYASINGNAAQGAAYMFANSNGTWAQVQKLTASDGTAGDHFGNSVAFDGTTVLIGSPYHAVNGNLKQGAAYVFTDSGGIWSQTQELVASDGAAVNFFGWSVDVLDAIVLVGADHATISGNLDQGAVYVFHNSGNSWNQTQKLTADDGAASDNFGWSVALDDAIALIGANFATINGQSQQGAAYVFANSDGTWNQTQKLVASDGAAGDKLGQAVAISGSNVLVGANWATIDGNESQGAAYFYGESDLGLALSAPETVGQGQTYVSQTIATNDASATSPAVTATVTVPAAASFVSASASQGTCSEDSDVVTCDFGAIDGNAGTATANVTLRATGNVDDTIDNTASIALATPPLTASAPTTITAGGTCPDGYSEYDGTLNPGGVARSPVYQAPGGSENAILTAPAGFQLYAVYQSGRFGRNVYLVPGNEVHRWGPKGLYMWLVRARDGQGAYTLCLQHP